MIVIYSYIYVHILNFSNAKFRKWAYGHYIKAQTVADRHLIVNRQVLLRADI